MQQIITAKLKLTTEPEQFEALRQTQLAYRDALNAASRYAFEQGKISKVTRLHKGMYAELRARYGLPSQLACSVERQVSATYKGLWTRLKKNAVHRRASITKKRFKGLDQPPRYSSPTVQYTYERDYTFRGMTGGRRRSICWCPLRLTFPIRPVTTSPKQSGSMSAFAIWP